MLRRALGFLVVAAVAIGCSSGQDDASDSAELSQEALCSRPLRGLGKCPLPASTCSSELGKQIATETWHSTHENGTIPTLSLYSSKNTWSAPLVDSPAIFGKMADMIRAARHEVDLETFEWGPTVFSPTDPGGKERWGTDPTTVLVQALVDLSAARAREGASEPIDVHVTVDGVAERSVAGGDTSLEKMHHLARQLASVTIDPRYVAVHLAAHERVATGGMHSKLMVVDGYKALLTGANPQDQQGLNQHWHDTGYVVTGEIGVAFQKSFDDTWHESSEVSCDANACKKVRRGEIEHTALVSAPDLDADPALAGACTPMFAATRRAFGATNLGGLPPDNVDNPQDAAFSSMMRRAETILKIESPNLNDGHAKDALIDAARRGVDVHVIISLGFNSAAERMKVAGLSVGGGSNEDAVLELMKRAAGAHVCDKLQIRWNPMRDGSRPSWGNEVPGASHTKYMTIDGKIAMVGSGNQDMTSWNLTRETNVVIDSADATHAYDAAVFDHDWPMAFDVVDWARGVRDGKVEPQAGIDLDELLGGDAHAWADAVVAACGR